MKAPLELFGIHVHPWTMSETIDEIARRIEARVFTQHSVVNVAKIVNIQRDEQLRESVLGSDIIGVDGMGVVWGARLLGCDIPERVTGIDLFEKLLALSSQKKWPVFLLGAKPDIVEKTASVLTQMHPSLQIAGFHHGYFWDDQEAVVRKIQSSNARLLFVAITSPQKENFINEWKSDLGVDFVMGVGGSFDVFAGKVRRAPRWMQAAGLEWLFRIALEPRRMWKRYLVTNTFFALMLIKARVSGRT